MEMKIKSLDETKIYAFELAKRLKPGAVVCLEGDLGAGKTTFTQFLCEALGVSEYVTSPSFSIMNAYEGLVEGVKIPIYHFDVYRISDPDEMDEIGFDEFLFGSGISVIEWAGMIVDRLPDEAIWIELRLDEMGTRVLRETIKSERKSL
ncbi:tRNA (adenosine(37)-N6)-threonylcarbamoyltransferase complex ATPase subunit type 1 TsaE [Fusibacter tunisiensis]|uniref:tRNA threonylcarbamoyladenosine biosynthesis protein TsaE n=1 Tax=Fusibacter tunisiensis TaxID=1008308 RepID=A0ABS2MPN9_9FIRM|nr:tRNA (adenosine(37)-N6)-threonylcarbamoyltransferase complex ATPase subunit type 1 TsaE [Fusibacter tunisiensis]MBM7561348.1 tRNA threonylcarbamoyladenosine biosynthesis protein TsaE [Fusibacter tunisiensis]